MDNFVIAGQSNASGQGVLAELPVFVNADKAWLYTNAGHWSYLIEPSDSNIGQVDAVSSDPITGASFASSFADSLYALTGRPVGLIPCAFGGSSIDQWTRVAGLSRSTLYGSMIARANEAADRGALRGIIYYQGEIDTSDAILTASWPAKFLQWVADVRSDLGIPDLPIIMTVLGPDPHSPVLPYWADMVANQQQMILPHNCTRVFATDLSSKSVEPIHMTTSAQVILGQRYATAFHTELGV